MKKNFSFTLAAIAVLGLFFLAAPVLAAEPANMAGTWNMFVETPSGQTGAPNFVVKQEGDVLSGWYEGAFGEADITGKVTGNSFVIEFMSGTSKMVYTGTVTGNTCEGNIDFGGQGTGTFEGKRRK